MRSTCSVRAEEDGVDREAHEPHVNGGSGTKENAFVPLESGSAEEASHACERCLCEETPPAHEAAVLTL